MPIMSLQKRPMKNKQLKTEMAKELNFLKNVFSVLSIPLQTKDGNEFNKDYEIVNGSPKDTGEKVVSKRALSIAELEEKLDKMKSQNNFNLKNKLARKSLSSKLKKIKKRDRLNMTRIKPDVLETKKNQETEKPNVNVAKPVFNNDGKLVFSKFDFANIGQRDKGHKAEKDPKKILDNLKQQEQKFRLLEKKEDTNKAKELKEKIAWKNILQKAEGQKVKDDPTLLKKSIKKMEQKKKQSKTTWEQRVKGVEQKKEDRQKKRQENISKKKKEKRSRIVKAAVKRGRVVI